MQNNDGNVDDDYALAMQLQEQFNKEYGINFNQVNIKEESVTTHENDDYTTALRLQQMYDKKQGTFENDYEDIVPRMSNMTFKHQDNEEETYSNETKSRKEEFNRENYFGNDDTPPPYSSPLKPAYNDNNSWLAYNNSGSSQKPANNDNVPWLAYNNNNSPQRPAYNDNVPWPAYNSNDSPQRPAYNNNVPWPAYNNNDSPQKPAYNDNNPWPAYNNNDSPQKPAYNDNNPWRAYYNNNDSPQKPAYNDNNPWRAYNNNIASQTSQQMPQNQQQKTSSDQSDLPGMLAQILEAIKNQQNNQNNNQPDYSTHTLNNNNSNIYSTTRNRINLSGQGVFKVLLLGGTGTGKSTIINTMANYFLGGTLDKPKIVIPTKYYEVTEREFASKHSEAKLDDVTKSQTTKCYNYTFNHPDNPAYEFVFIDTPGLSDTNGVKQDDKNIQRIIDTAISAGSLSAIVIIANGTEARVTPSIKNTLVRLANNLPDEVINRNLLLILTKCSKSSASFSEDAFTKEIAKPKKIFYMDNQGFCTDPQVWKSDEDERFTVQYHWDKSVKTIDNLLTTITELSSTSTQAFQNMKNCRDKIKSEITKVTQDIANIQRVQDSLDAAQKALQKTGDQKKSFANYTKTESIKLKKIVNASYHSTVCSLHLKENIICHEHCGLEFKNSSGTNHFKHCACMGPNDLCMKCGCGPLSHFHDKVKLVEETQTVNKILEDVKAQFDNANQQHQKFSSDANSYQSSLSALQAAANAKYGHIHKLCHDLSKICSRFNFVDELHANIESMKQDSRAIQNTQLRKNAEVEIQRLEKLANDLSSKRGRNY